MKVIDEALLATFRTGWWCENCRCPPTFWHIDAHHVFSKGAGQVDIVPNLIGLCRKCHSGAHSLRPCPSRTVLLEMIAARESTTPERIEELVQQVRRDSRKVWDVSKQGPAIGKCELCGEWAMIEELEDGLCVSCQEQIEWEETQ